MEKNFVIAINLLFIRPGEVGGSEVFVVNLINNLLKIDKENRYLLIVSRNNKNVFNFDSKNIEYLIFNFDNSLRLKRLFFEQIILPQKLKKKKIDLLVASGNTGLVRCPCKQILIVHDLIYFVYPEYYSLIKKIYLQNLVRYSCQKADRIATVSQNTKKDIIKYTKVEDDKIDIVYEGVDFERFSKFKKEEAKKFTQKQYGVQEYIYSPTSLYLHKNNDLLIEAFFRLKKEKKIPQKLLITGNDPYKRTNWLKSIIGKYGMKNEIFYLGRVPDEYLPLLYSGADITMYLSKYEGFGLPVLEAMAAGCPVLSSNRSSLPEVVGNAGVLIDPFNIDEVVNKMSELLINKSLREQCVKNGLIRARQFSWENVARRMIKTYNNL